MQPPHTGPTNLEVPAPVAQLLWATSPLPVSALASLHQTVYRHTDRSRLRPSRVYHRSAPSRAIVPTYAPNSKWHPHLRRIAYVACETTRANRSDAHCQRETDRIFPVTPDLEILDPAASSARSLSREVVSWRPLPP